MIRQGEWSDFSWLSTIPDVPDAPPQPVCSTEAETADQRIRVRLQEAEENGQPIEAYEVHVANATTGEVLVVLNHTILGAANGTKEDGGSGDGGGGGGTERLVVHVTNASSLNFSGIPLRASSEYRIAVRAWNGLGPGGWSAAGKDCSTGEPYSGGFPWWVLVAALGMFVLLMIGIFVAWRCTDLPKVLAPKMRKLELNLAPLCDFIVKEDTALEDFDPELQMNPVSPIMSRPA